MTATRTHRRIRMRARGRLATRVATRRCASQRRGRERREGERDGVMRRQGRAVAALVVFASALLVTLLGGRTAQDVVRTEPTRAREREPPMRWMTSMSDERASASSARREPEEREATDAAPDARTNVGNVDGDDDDGYVSVGKIPKTGLLNGMDLEEGDNLFTAAKRRSHRREVILINSNAGGVVLTANLVSALRRVGIEHFIVYTESEETCVQRIIKAGARDIDCAWTSYMKTHPRLELFGVSSDTGADAFRLWWSRMEYMWRLSGEGYNVMYVDTDVSFRSNPYPAIKLALGDIQLLAQGEYPGALGLNIGFMYIQNAKKDGIARGVFAECIARMLSVLESEPPLRKWNGDIARGAKESLWDQHIFNDVVASAVVGRFIDPRQGQRIIAPEKRHEWVAEQRFATDGELRWAVKRSDLPLELLPERFRSDEAFAEEFDRGNASAFAVHYRPLTKLREYVDERENVAAAPFWLLDGWTGAGWSAKTQGANNAWVGAVPVMMAHFVGGYDKTLEMKALGWWDYSADAYATPSTLDVEATRGRFLSVAGLAIEAETSAEALHRVKLETLKLVKLAMATKRRVVAPTVSCSATFIDKRPIAHYGVWSQNEFVLSVAKPGGDTNETTCVPKHMACPGVIVQAVEFRDDERYKSYRGASDDVRVVVDAASLLNDGLLDVEKLRKSALPKSTAMVVLDVSTLRGSVPELREDETWRKALHDGSCRSRLFRKDREEFKYPW